MKSRLKIELVEDRFYLLTYLLYCSVFYDDSYDFISCSECSLFSRWIAM